MCVTTHFRWLLIATPTPLLPLRPATYNNGVHSVTKVFTKFYSLCNLTTASTPAGFDWGVWGGGGVTAILSDNKHCSA